MTKRLLIAANWKMHGRLDWISKLSEFEDLYASDQRLDKDILICPPFPLIAPLVKAAKGNNIAIGAQSCDPRDDGAHTGQVNASMLASVGASYIIAGHSERRAEGERNEDIKAQVEAILGEGLTPILCVGEAIEVREDGRASDFVLAQLKACWPDELNGRDIVVAYEPVWAVGTGKVPSLDDIVQMHGVIADFVGDNIRILYGGSVKPANSANILSLENVDGVLIGGASLEMSSLAAIAKSV